MAQETAQASAITIKEISSARLTGERKRTKDKVPKRPTDKGRLNCTNQKLS